MSRGVIYDGRVRDIRVTTGNRGNPPRGAVTLYSCGGKTRAFATMTPFEARQLSQLLADAAARAEETSGS